MNDICEFNAGSNYIVDVTHINDPHSFYVRSANFRDILDTIEKPGSPMSAQMLQLGRRVIYKSNILGKNVRGEIHYIVGHEYDIFAIDYGCFEKSILLEQIYSLDSSAESTKKYPALAVHCQLYLCEPRDEGFNEKVKDAMISFIGESTAVISVKSKINYKLVVELWSRENSCDVSKMLSLIHLTTMIKHNNTVNRQYYSLAQQGSASSSLNLTRTLNYEHRILKLGDTLHVRVQSGTSLSSFYVAEINEYKKIQYGQASFATYCKDRPMQEQDIVPGRPCAVKLYCPPKYERAIIKEVIEPESTATLQLVDWGTEVKAPFNWIKSVVSEIYFSQPIIAIYCSTNEDQVWHTGLPKFLFPGYEFMIKIMEVGNEFQQPHRVNIYPLKMHK